MQCFSHSAKPAVPVPGRRIHHPFPWNIGWPSGTLRSFHGSGMALRRYLGQRINLFVQYKCYLLTVHAQLLEDEVGDIFTYFHHALKYMHGLDGLLSTALYRFTASCTASCALMVKLLKFIFCSPFYFISFITLGKAQKICHYTFRTNCLHIKYKMTNCL